MYHFKFIITFRHCIPCPTDNRDYVLLRQKLQGRILERISYFCKPVEITPTISDFFYYPDEEAQRFGTDYCGTSVSIEKQLNKLSSYRCLANYFESVVCLLSTILPQIWTISKTELIEPS